MRDDLSPHYPIGGGEEPNTDINGVFGRPSYDFPMHGNMKIVTEQWKKEVFEAQEKERILQENAKADAKAIWLLADHYVPADVKEAAKRWHMEDTLVEIWRGAFIEGWRVAHRSK